MRALVEKRSGLGRNKSKDGKRKVSYQGRLSVVYVTMDLDSLAEKCFAAPTILS